MSSTPVSLQKAAADLADTVLQGQARDVAALDVAVISMIDAIVAEYCCELTIEEMWLRSLAKGLFAGNDPRTLLQAFMEREQAYWARGGAAVGELIENIMGHEQLN